MRALLIAAGLLLAACQPMPSVDAGSGSGGVGGSWPENIPATAEGCRAQGGAWGPQGLLGRDGCVLPLADAGKRCTDGDQCLGDCRAVDGPSFPQIGQAATGQCQANTSPFGCFTRVEDGRAEATLCVD